MSEIAIASIVEGHGEIEAVPVLVRRVALDLDPGLVPRILKPQRLPASLLLKAGELERSVELAGRKVGDLGGVVVVLDCDWHGSCPATDGPALLARARATRGDLPISVVLARMEFEAWFLAAAESIKRKTWPAR